MNNGRKELALFELAIKLYNAKKGTVNEICADCGIDNRTGMVYKYKNRLIGLGILEHSGHVFINGRQFVVYRVVHKKIDRFIFSKFEIGRIMFERIRSGQIDIPIFG